MRSAGGNWHRRHIQLTIATRVNFIYKGDRDLCQALSSFGSSALTNPQMNTASASDSRDSCDACAPALRAQLNQHPQGNITDFLRPS